MKNKKLIFIIISILLFCVYFSMYLYKWEYRERLLEIHFLSLDKGRGIFIRTPEGKAILIGGGSDSEIIRRLTELMPFYNRKIDTLIIPSANKNQIGSQIDIINRYEIGEIIRPRIMATSTVLDILLKNLKKKKIHITTVNGGDILPIEDNINMRILFPYEGFKFNNSSLPELAIEIDYASTSVYMMGDLSKAIQKDIARYITENININIIEYYNNANKTDISDQLIYKVKAKYIWNKKSGDTTYYSDGRDWYVE